jgi:exoribonuclease R
MMIAANQVAGLYAAQHGLFVPYRHQAAPNEVDPDLLRELDGTFWLVLPRGQVFVH